MTQPVLAKQSFLIALLAGAQAIICWALGTPLLTVLRGMRDAGMTQPVFISAANLATYFPNLPTKIVTNQDLLNLPVYNPTASIYAGVPVGRFTLQP